MQQLTGISVTRSERARPRFLRQIASAASAFLLASALAIPPLQAQPAPAPGQAPVNLTLHVDQPGHPVSPTLYGLMTEEINYSYDGGLYAELVRNRIFKNDPRQPANWSVAALSDKSASIALDNDQKINESLTVCLKLDASKLAQGRAGIANEGYWGIPIKPATTYRASFYAKGSTEAPLKISLESPDGHVTFAQAQVGPVSGEWKRYEATLATAADVKPTVDARVVISTEKAGTYWFNLVSVFPPTYKNRPNGNRQDLMQLLVDMKPKFLRFPGGNFLEGPEIEDRFPWKKTLGDLANRPGHNGSWGYRPSDGMGLHEFLEWCEDMNAEAVLGVYAGYSLRGAHIEPGEKLEPFVQEALDEIEYVIGDASTKWGAERARNGHPAPFKLQYIEIGNEDWFDKSGSYAGRYDQVSKAIRAKYPQLKLISTVWFDQNAKAVMEKAGDRVDLRDEHYYRNSQDMFANASQYDKVDRKGTKVFVGEWATREGAPTTNWQAALGDAAWLTGMERNSDLVVMSCYAPLFVNVNRGGMQWPSDLIGYDAMSSYGSPSYHVQKMFSEYLGDRVVPVEASGIPMQTIQRPQRDRPPGAATRAATGPTTRRVPPPERPVPSVFTVATQSSQTGQIYLKLVNAAPQAQDVHVQLQGLDHVAAKGKLILISSEKPTDTNTITEPTRIVPVTSDIDGLATTFDRKLPAYSVSVIVLETK